MSNEKFNPSYILVDATAENSMGVFGIIGYGPYSSEQEATDSIPDDGFKWVVVELGNPDCLKKRTKKSK